MVRQVPARRERRFPCAPCHDSGFGESYMVNFMLGSLPATGSRHMALPSMGGSANMGRQRQEEGRISVR